MLPLIHFLRGLASVMVLFFHVANHIENKCGNKKLANFFEFGDSGVQFFFVLSGFIIFYTTSKNHGNTELIGDYFKKRFLRIYIPYWIIVFALFFAYQLFSDLGEARHRDIIYMLKSLTLLPNEEGQFLGIAWTLAYEVIFYTIFGIAFIRSKFLYIAVSLLLLMGFSRVLGIEYQFWSNPNWLLFVLGIFAAIVIKNYDLSRFYRPILLIGFIFYAVTAYLHVGVAKSSFIPEYDISVISYGIASFIIIIGASYSKLRIGKVFGDLSYGLYLVHIPVIAAVTSLTTKIGINLFVNPLFAFFVLSICSFIVAYVFSYYLELPLVKVLQKCTLKKFSHRSDSGV